MVPTNCTSWDLPASFKCGLKWQNQRKMEQMCNFCWSRTLYNMYLNKHCTVWLFPSEKLHAVYVWARLHVCVHCIVRDGARKVQKPKKKSLKIVLQCVLRLPTASNNHCWHQQSISQHGQLWSARCQGVYLQNLHAAPPLRSCAWTRTADPGSEHGGGVLRFLPEATVQQSHH